MGVHFYSVMTKLQRSYVGQDVGPQPNRDDLPTPCTCDTPGAWESDAQFVLLRNDIDPVEFFRALAECLLQDLKKRPAARHSQILLCGRTTSGKTWVLGPIETIFHAMPPPPRRIAIFRCVE